MNEQLHPVFKDILNRTFAPTSGRIYATLTWIPVLSECPPPEMFRGLDKYVLVSVDGEPDAIPAWYDGAAWCLLSGHEINGTVTHWAERPAGLTP